MEPFSLLDTEGIVAALRAAGCVYAEAEATILVDAAVSPQELAGMVAGRVSGIPLEHLVGWAYFHGLRMAVAPGVFVPRVRTEFLVDKALEVLRTLSKGPGLSKNGPTVVDLCCGSGAVGAALAHEFGGLDLHAADIDPAAVACAAENLLPAHGRAYCGDLFAPLPEKLRGTVEVIVANAPYVPTEEIAFMPPEARLHEPHAALNGGADGLDIQRRIAALAPAWLRPGGYLLVETSVRQGAESAAIMASHGFTATLSHSEELAGTVVTGRL